MGNDSARVLPEESKLDVHSMAGASGAFLGSISGSFMTGGAGGRRSLGGGISPAGHVSVLIKDKVKQYEA